MIPISCLTEFPNVVQMAKVRRAVFIVQRLICCDSVEPHSNIFLSFFKKSKLVCEEVNVDRFFPVLYPKVSSGLVCIVSAAVYAVSSPTQLTI